MWIFTNKGMISAVRNRDEIDTVLVRARKRAHLSEFFQNDSEVQIYQDDTADYPFRANVSIARFKQATDSQIDDITYTNFKGSIHMTEDGYQYHEACMNVWATMVSYQKGYYDPENPNTNYFEGQ